MTANPITILSSEDDDALLRAAFDASAMGICFLDACGIFQRVNPAFCGMLGYPAAEIRGRPWTIAAPLELAEQGQQFIDTLLAEHSRHPEEWQLRRRDGSQLTVLVTFKAISIEGKQRRIVASFTNIEARKAVHEAALRRSEDLYRNVVENATEGILVLQDGVIVFANARILQMTGYAREQLIGQTLGHDIHPDDLAMVQERHRRRMRGESVAPKVAFRVVHLNSGKTIWVEVATVTIEWEGRPAALAFVTDITVRKALEDKLKQTLAERETVLENSIVGIAFLNAEGRANWGNRAMYQIFGVDDDTPGGMSLEPFYPSREDYLKTGAMVAESVARSETFQTELQMRRKDGRLFWAYLSGRAVNPKDLSHGTVWVVMDITKRRELEIALNKSEEHYRHVIDNVTECILVVQDGHIVFANPRLMQLTGYTQEELFAQPFVAPIHPEDRGLVIDHHMRRLRGEKVEQYYQFRIVNALSGAVIWVQLSAVMIDWEGRPATLSFMTDVTERKRLEDSLKHSMAERIRLETLQIQAELKEAELARRHAEETTRAKSMFLANMSHEIRTPMNAIIGMAHLALRTELEPKQRDYIEKIRSAGISLLGIINDILDFSKIEADKLDVEQVVFNLDDVLSNVATVTGARANEKRLEYVLQVPLDIPRALVGDPLRLGQVLINLINNAIKFTDYGEIFVACTQVERSDEQVMLQFVVRDTGIGMTPEQTAKLFRAFSQADETTTRKYGGTGLGLSIAKRLVELMGGTIWLESEPEVGTVIRFTARFGLGDMQERRRVAPDVLNGMRVLVVDDNPTARAVLADSLTALPVQVDLATTAGEALDMIHSADSVRPYGVVFTDLEMPDMDGIDLIVAVKNDDTLGAPPRMVLLSSQGREEARFRIERARPDNFLMKPVNASILVDTLVELFLPHRHGAGMTTTEIMPRFHGLTALLVEDNEINQQIAMEMMQAVGIRVEIAGNGRIALDKLMIAGPERYGMVFMDVQMPEMDGHEATRRIRADARFDGLPILAMTAHAMVEERERCFAAGMNDHLAKPINPSELYAALVRWCPHHLVRDGAQAENTAKADADGRLEIEGIDVQDGLKRALGNRAFYLQMLERFRDSQRTTAVDIRAALDAEPALAEQLGHSLKGVAGLLGAKTVQELAGHIEAGLRSGLPPDSLRPLGDQLVAALDIVHRAIDKVLKTHATPSATVNVVVDRAKVQAVVRRFAVLLHESDGEATNLLAQENDLLSATLDEAIFSDIVRAVRQYDFDAALALLRSGAAAAGFYLGEEF